MGNLNKVLLIGRLGQDPEKRITPAGHTVVNISIATTEYYKDQSGNKRDRTEWHKVVLWNRQAEVVEQYCRKGSQLYIEGSLQTRDWQDKDGNKRYTTEIVCRNFQLLDSKSQGNQNSDTSSQGGFRPNVAEQQGSNELPPQGGNQYQEQPQGGSNPPNADDDFVEDDIPF